MGVPGSRPRVGRLDEEARGHLINPQENEAAGKGVACRESSPRLASSPHDELPKVLQPGKKSLYLSTTAEATQRATVLRSVFRVLSASDQLYAPAVKIPHPPVRLVRVVPDETLRLVIESLWRAAQRNRGVATGSAPGLVVATTSRTLATFR